MTRPVTSSAESIVKALVEGRQAERMEAQRVLDEKAAGINSDLVRRLILEALSGKYAPREQDDVYSGARCWLLGSLAFVPASGGEPDRTLIRFVDEDHEKRPWPRYWALQALLHRGAPGLEQVCRDKVVNDSEILPRFLAKAILAARDDRSCADDLKAALTTKARNQKAEADKWAVLRALRFVYLPFAGEQVSELVLAAARKNTFSDVTFDAIVALGNVPRDTREASTAANALISIVTHSRQYQYWDVMRIRAIEGLGKLQVSHAASLLLDELTDLNPSIVKEAALALEQVLGAETMTARILERLATAEDHAATLPLFADALRFLSDEKAAVNKLESAMVSGPLETRELARRLLSEMGGSYAVDKLTAQAQGVEHYLEVLDDSDRKLRDLFEGTIEEGRRGFRIVTVMDVTLFVAGLVMLGLAIGLATADKTLIAVLTASGGILSALYGRFFARPRQQVEASVTHLAVLKTIFLGYLRQLRQIDQTYARRMLEKEAPSAAQAEAFTVLVQRVMDGALGQLGTHQGIRHGQEKPEPPAPSPEPDPATSAGPPPPTAPPVQ